MDLYNNNNNNLITGGGIDPKLWGPYGWKILHRLSFHFSSIEEAKTFYMSLQYILPCPKCRIAYNTHLKSIPFPKNIKLLPKWVYLIHSRVNDNKNSNIVNPSFNEIKKFWILKKNSNDKDEWIFIQTLAEMHSGKKVTKEYIDNLYNFITLWMKYSNINIPLSYDILKSKMKFKSWIRQNKIKLTKVYIKNCNEYTCSI